MSLYDSTTALIVADVQNDFAARGGSLYVRGAEDIIPFVNQQIAQARQAGSLVVYTQDWHPEETPHFERDGGTWPVHCVHDTWGAQFHPELDVTGGEVVRKGTGGEDGYSAFTVRDPITLEEKSTGLAELLRRRGIRRVVIVGLTTDYCVKESALDAVRLGFDTTVLQDGVRAVNLRPEDGQRDRLLAGLDGTQRVLAGVGEQHVVSLNLQHRLEVPAHFEIVVGDQNRFRPWKGVPCFRCAHCLPAFALTSSGGASIASTLLPRFSTYGRTKTKVAP